MGTIRVSSDTKSRLVCLKENQKESFDSVINRLIDFHEDDDPLTREDIEGIKEALEDLREGRFFTHEEVKEKLGLNKEQPFTLIYAHRAVKDLEELSERESGSPRLSETFKDEIRAIKEYEKKGQKEKRRNSPRQDLPEIP